MKESEQEKSPNDRTHLETRKIVKEYFVKRGWKEKGKRRPSLEYFLQIMQDMGYVTFGEVKESREESK